LSAAFRIPYLNVYREELVLQRIQIRFILYHDVAVYEESMQSLRLKNTTFRVKSGMKMEVSE
jgi:hypothetical protein